MPGWLTRWFLRVRATLSARHDQELRDELQLHLNLLAEEYIAQGIPPDLARRRARREFGNPTRFQEALARSESRRREFVIRLALGGGTWRLIRQSATECILLAVVAGFLGLLLAGWATTVSMKQFAVMIMPVEFGLELDTRVLTFAIACVAVVIAFGLWPCTRPARSAATAFVYQSTGSSGLARRQAIAGRAMLIVQLAMCTVLLIGAGLLLRTVSNLRSQELGFDRNVLLVSISPGQAGYAEQASAMLIIVSENIWRPCPASRPLACRGQPSWTTPTTGLTAASS